MTWKLCQKNWSHPDLRYQLGIYLQQHIKTTNNLSHTQSLGWDLNLCKSTPTKLVMLGDLFVFGAKAPKWPKASSFTRFLDNTQ